ncbi:hypothetical protein CHIBA101_0162 [Actinomyces sp. Chiba101]|nr:hypothetical protein CHIBA101_0162 [Actinomyces sp. Chiba101]GAV95033.1 hypothetical protein ADENT20671_1810 [Actinomyces denticolens]
MPPRATDSEYTDPSGSAPLGLAPAPVGSVTRIVKGSEAGSVGSGSGKHLGAPAL